MCQSHTCVCMTPTKFSLRLVYVWLNAVAIISCYSWLLMETYVFFRRPQENQTRSNIDDRFALRKRDRQGMYFFAQRTRVHCWTCLISRLYLIMGLQSEIFLRIANTHTHTHAHTHTHTHNTHTHTTHTHTHTHQLYNHLKKLTTHQSRRSIITHTNLHTYAHYTHTQTHITHTHTHTYIHTYIT